MIVILYGTSTLFLQIIVSLQMVYEEKVLTDYDIAPLQAVGWEGTVKWTSILQKSFL